MHSKIASINIVDKNKILNRNHVPILYIFGDSDVVDKSARPEQYKAIFEDETFKEKILSLALDKERYATISVNYFIIDFNNNERYTEYNLYIQDIYTLKSLDNNFWLDIVTDVFYELYGICSKDDANAKPIDNTLTNIEQIKSIYSYVIKKYKEKVDSKYIFNFVQKQLESIGLHSTNTQYIIEKLNDTLKN